MYSLNYRLIAVKGIGKAMEEKLALRNIITIQDLLLFLPLRYRDLSKRSTIEDLVIEDEVTIQATLKSISSYYRNRRSIQRATVQDNTGRLKLMWFNIPNLAQALIKGKEYLVSGKINDRGVMIHPSIEKVSDDSIHTDRLVPMYSSITDIKQGNLRRTIKHILDNLKKIEDQLENDSQHSLFSIRDSLTQLHFPDTVDHVVQARERLALEELLGLMHHSKKIKKEWSREHRSFSLKTRYSVPKTIPFTLTKAQVRSTKEILKDLKSTTPMNRLLVGDVGSGKTIVAGLSFQQVINNGYSAALVAPTQILAEQHMETFEKLFPDIQLELVTGKNKKALASSKNSKIKLYIGTHAVLNRLSHIKPALIIYDEQHRFGVKQRSQVQKLERHPHVLTMSATPIPRSLMLTIFSHLSLSTIDEMPAGRKPVKTWLVPEKKRESAYQWINKLLTLTKVRAQTLIICPFIDPSNHLALENIASATETYKEIKKSFAKIKTNKSQTLSISLLHGKMSSKEKEVVTKKLFAREIDILVATPIVEIGIDLPAASIIIIEAAQRFGLASLHQLRGRVGRAGQQAYCLLFTSSESGNSKKRLKFFTKNHDGTKLAEQDLKHRGAGDLFGTEQHGFESLRFANWTNLELITMARKIYLQLGKDHNWQPFLSVRKLVKKEIPMAN